jgi:hypothetical protein
MNEFFVSKKLYKSKKLIKKYIKENSGKFWISENWKSKFIEKLKCLVKIFRNQKLFLYFLKNSIKVIKWKLINFPLQFFSFEFYELKFNLIFISIEIVWKTYEILN